MTTFRIRHTRCYTSIANSAIQDKRLSLKARGLHHLLLSYPNSWEVNAKHLVEQSDRDGRDAIYSALKELIKFGYIKKINHRKDGGKFKDVSYDVFELPNTEKPNTENPEMAQPITDLPNTEKPDTEKPNTENPYAYKGLNSTKDLIDQGIKEEKETPTFDASLQEESATQPEEINSSVQTKVQNSGQTGSASLDSGQPKSVGKDQGGDVPPPPKVGVVTYKQSPESIDLSELWEFAEYEAKAEARALAPGHRHPALVAHGLGDIWVGPNVSDFDAGLLALIAKNKKAGNHPDNRAACVTFITRAIRDADWAKLEALWLDVQRKTRQQPALAVIDAPLPKKETGKYSPPPTKNWAKNVLGARYRNAS
ncbi:hypothetical protein Lepto7375DRAFT_0622 [Leptolyngbya sp. PCC 7375]|nr:hypothetical protein Lepto7375DRAFT_0622 [Leptolyngbya sp. PCC 7375]